MTEDTAGQLARDEGNDVPALIASIPASVQQLRAALGIVIFFSVVFALIVPFGSN